jgi:prophage DNA circulation protein
MSRDWPSTLWPASYMGVPFWVEDDGAEGGRRLAVTELPGVDWPDIEDLGNKVRPIDVQGYTLGDFSDAQMDALEAVCNSEGPGTLVMPAQGPLMVHCESFKRGRKKPQAGKFTFSAKFILVGASSIASPPEYLAQLTFDAVAGLRSASVGFLGQLSV